MAKAQKATITRLRDARAQSMREKAYLYLQRKILSGELPAGTALSEASIARELGSSRTPLREAIGRLVAQGFLRQIPNRGSVVVEFGKRDVAELADAVLWPPRVELRLAMRSRARAWARRRPMTA